MFISYIPFLISLHIYILFEEWRFVSFQISVVQFLHHSLSPTPRSLPLSLSLSLSLSLYPWIKLEIKSDSIRRIDGSIINHNINLTVTKFRNKNRIFGPSKCPVYFRLPWISPASQSFVDKISFCVSLFYYCQSSIYIYN